MRPARSGAVSLAEVAAMAGVSAATVSRAINRPSMVKAELRGRVEAAVKALGYVPNGAARALASRQTFAMGAIVPTLNNTLFSGTIDAFQRRLDQLGYVTFVTSTEYDDEREVRHARSLVEHGIDGLMLVGYRHDSSLYALLRERNVPFVNSWAAQEDSPYPAIGYSGQLGGELSANYLLSLGHRSFGVIIGNPAKNDRMETRLQGIRAALGAAGVALHPDNIVFSGYSIEDGRQGCAELFARGARPTAILAGNDILALGILLECMHRGIAVPGDVSIMGFGDSAIAANFIPPMSTVRISSGEVGTAIADYLVARAKGSDGVLPPVNLQLLPRGTTSAPNASVLAPKVRSTAHATIAAAKPKNNALRPTKR